MNTTRKSSPAIILAAWLVVGLPAVWGIYNTGKNAAKLFHPQASVAAQK